jgi:hypothetical protein
MIVFDVVNPFAQDCLAILAFEGPVAATKKKPELNWTQLQTTSLFGPCCQQLQLQLVGSGLQVQPIGTNCNWVAYLATQS